MGHDDHQIGHILTRRELLSSLGVIGAAAVAGPKWLRTAVPSAAAASALSGIPGCVVRPAQEEGPYFVDEKLNRSDIRSDPVSGVLSLGTPLSLTVSVANVVGGACAPAPGVMVDIWHCDAAGVYSDEEDMNARFNSKGKKFLRGYQVTDAKGIARFETIYPGWYEGRAIHIHFKLRTGSGGRAGKTFTSQMYFDEAMNEKVMASAPYSAKGKGRLLNAADGIFQNGGKQLILPITPAGKGFAGTFEIGMVG